MGFLLLRRLFGFALALMLASVVVFAMLEWLPGNAAEVMLGDTASPQAVAALSQKLGLDRPALVRYLEWTGGLLQGHTALSTSYDTPTWDLIVERLAVTLPLAVMAMVLTVAAALCGLFSATRPLSGPAVLAQPASRLRAASASTAEPRRAADK